MWSRISLSAALIVWAITLAFSAHSGQQEAADRTFRKGPWLRSHAAVIVDQQSGRVLFEKNAGLVLPIASLTKLVTAMVILDSGQDMDEVLAISAEDKDTLRYSRSRLPVGTRLTRRELLGLALTASENRAASALARYWPGGQQAFIDAMRNKTRDLGLAQTNLVDSTGLHQDNRSSARDLVSLIQAAWGYPLIREFSSRPRGRVHLQPSGRLLKFNNTNPLLRRAHWEIGLSKTGYIRESGRCLLMQTTIQGRGVLIALLNAQGRLSSFGDSGRIRRWLETAEGQRIAAR